MSYKTIDTLRRTIHPEIKVLDAKQGLAEYVASDETLDSYREVIRADGWRFNLFAKNAPFVDSHDYSSVEKLLGRVVDFTVKGRQLVETVQWAKDAGNRLAEIGWKMTEGGFLKAVSVGFWPVKCVTKADAEYARAVTDLGIKSEDKQPSTIYTEQEQIELSAVIIGANPNALARSYKAGVLTDADIDTLSQEQARTETASRSQRPADDLLAARRAEQAFLERLERALAKL